MNGTQINYYFLCHRKLWLFVHRIEMEHNSDLVAVGKIISDTTYKRAEHEIRINSGNEEIVIDFYDGKEKVIHEIKKSDKMEELHIWQVKYYLSILEDKGIYGATAEIDYPKLKQKIRVELTDKDREELGRIRDAIDTIIKTKKPPKTIKYPFCRNCSYFDLCFI